MKLISWNVNGLRAVVTKGFKEFFNNVDADIFCLQETKLQEEQVDKNIKSIFNGYNEYWNCAEKKGYSGTAVFSKLKPINVTYGIGIEEHDKEGRVITLEFEKFYMVTINFILLIAILQILNENLRDLIIVCNGKMHLEIIYLN